MTDNNRFIQCLAASLVVYGSLCVGFADRYNWRDLANVGNTIVGVGAGIITGQKLANVSNRDGGTINVTPDAATEVKP